MFNKLDNVYCCLFLKLQGKRKGKNTIKIIQNPNSGKYQHDGVDSPERDDSGERNINYLRNQQINEIINSQIRENLETKQNICHWKQQNNICFFEEKAGKKKSCIKIH